MQISYGTYLSDAEMQDLVDDLSSRLEETPGEMTAEAIRRGDEKSILCNLPQCKGPSSVIAKSEAMLHERLDLLRALLQHDNLVDQEMIVFACDQRDRASLQMLLEFGWRIDQSVCCTASMLCLVVDDLDLVQWLINRGADINARSENGETTLSVAIVDGSLEVVRFLMESGANIKYGDVLHCAAQRQDQAEGAALIHQFITNGADVNAHRYNNSVAYRLKGLSKLPTPLHTAIKERNLPVIRALLQHNADPYRQMLHAGRLEAPTPVQMALESNDQSLIEALSSTHYSALGTLQDSMKEKL